MSGGFNSGQGVQFTSHAFTGRLEEAGIRISMDGGDRCMDNIFVEWLWQSEKYVEVHLKDYDTVPEAVHGLGPTSNIIIVSDCINRWDTGLPRGSTEGDWVGWVHTCEGDGLDAHGKNR